MSGDGRPNQDDSGYVCACGKPQGQCGHGGQPALHKRIAATVAEWRKVDTSPMEAFVLAACDHADKVLARHKPCDDQPGPWCAGYGDNWPCPDVRDLADLWLGPGWEDQ